MAASREAGAARIPEPPDERYKGTLIARGLTKSYKGRQVVAGADALCHLADHAGNRLAGSCQLLACGRHFLRCAFGIRRQFRNRCRDHFGAVCRLGGQGRLFFHALPDGPRRPPKCQ